VGRKSKVKGAAGEREAAEALREHLGIDAHRGRQYSGGPNSPDVIHSLPGVNIEVKRVEKFSLYKALEQSRGDCGEGVIPIVLHRQNHQPWVVVVELKDLPFLAHQLYMHMALEADANAEEKQEA
jgi:Holliday junction resolvase